MSRSRWPAVSHSAWRISQLWPARRPATISTRSAASTEMIATTARNQEVAKPPRRSTTAAIQATKAIVSIAFEIPGRSS